MGMDGADGGATMQMYLLPPNCTLRMLTTVNFMLCTFYHKNNLYYHKNGFAKLNLYKIKQ